MFFRVIAFVLHPFALGECNIWWQCECTRMIVSYTVNVLKSKIRFCSTQPESNILLSIFRGLLAPLVGGTLYEVRVH